jgi:hypothetical protein
MYTYFAMYLGDDLTEFNAKLADGFSIDQLRDVAGKALLVLVKRNTPERNTVSGLTASAAIRAMEYSDTREPEIDLSTPNPFTYATR